jgi:hypothetical protein
MNTGDVFSGAIKRKVGGQWKTWLINPLLWPPKLPSVEHDLAHVKMDIVEFFSISPGSTLTREYILMVAGGSATPARLILVAE